MKPHQKRRTTFLGCEHLERRDAMATFGVPWPDPHRLTVSFVPDGTVVGTGRSDLFARMDARMPRAQWQGEILRAFQTWAAAADVDFTLVSDDGSPLGAPGLAQHDPRFGDIRIAGGSTSAGILAFGAPYDPVGGGTWPGDIVFGQDAAATTPTRDLYSIALHEAGHVLGLPPSTNPASTMYNAAIQRRTGLASVDVAAIAALYGARMAPGAAVPSTLAKAETIKPSLNDSGDYDGDVPLIAYGNLVKFGDRRFYRFDVPDGYVGAMTVRVQTGGVSLLRPTATLYDSRGVVLRTVSGAAGSEATTITFDVRPGQKRFYLSVGSGVSGAFGVGRFAVGVDFGRVTTMSPAEQIALLKLPLDGMSPSDVEKVLRRERNPLINDDRDSHGSTGTAIRLSPTVTAPNGRHFRALGSVSATGSDVYRIDAPRIIGAATGVLTVTARGFDVNPAKAKVELLDANGVLVPAKIIANGSGVFTIQAKGVALGKAYFVRVTSQNSTAGNYELTADVGTVAADVASFAAGRLTGSAATARYELRIAETQVFQFLLNATSTNATQGASATVTIRDATGVAVASFTSKIGETVSGPTLLLRPGTYTIAVTGNGLAGASGLAFDLFGETLDDPLGPPKIDPNRFPTTIVPPVPTYYYYFVNGVLVRVPMPYLVRAVPPTPTPPPVPNPTSPPPPTPIPGG